MHDIRCLQPCAHDERELVRLCTRCGAVESASDLLAELERYRAVRDRLAEIEAMETEAKAMMASNLIERKRLLDVGNRLIAIATALRNM